MLAAQLHGVTHQERRMVDPPEAAGAQERRFDVRQERCERDTCRFDPFRKNWPSSVLASMEPIGERRERCVRERGQRDARERDRPERGARERVERCIGRGEKK